MIVGVMKEADTPQAAPFVTVPQAPVSAARNLLRAKTGIAVGLATGLLPDVGAVALLALVTLGFFWRVVTGQNWMPADGGDLVSFLYPTYRFAAGALHSGVWPLWDPFLYLGAPHIADIQAGFLYPPNLLLFLIQPAFPYQSLQWLSIGHIWFAGAGMYLFLARGLRTRRLAALAGALAFMFSDAFVVHFGNLNFNAVASWLPWVFWAFRAGINESVKLRWAALAGVLLAIASFAGHIQATLFVLLALATYSGLNLWQQREEAAPGRRALAYLAYLATTLLVTVLLAAPILVPALQLTSYTARASWNYTEAAGYSLSPAQWIGWFIPGFFGRGPQFHWGAWPRVEVGYLGILPLILAGLALVLRRERRTWTWIGLAMASFILALGIYAIPHGWLTLLPGFSQLRAPARLVLLTDFALAALAAIGLDAALSPLLVAGYAGLQKVWRGLGFATGAVWAFGVPLMYLALLLVQNQDPAIVTRVSITLIAVMVFAGLLAASLFWLAALRGRWARPDTLAWAAAGLILLDLASNGAYQDLGNQDPSRTFQHPEIASFLAGQNGPFRIDARTGIDSLWQPDTSLFYGLEDVGGVVNPLILADVQRYWEGLGSRSSRLYDLLNSRYVIARKDVTLDWQKFKLVFDGDPNLNVYENQQVLPRAFIVSGVQSVGDHQAAWDGIHAAGFDPATVAFVETPSGGLPGGGHGSVSDMRSGPGRLALQVTADGPALLVVSQTWYPGWQVRVDGVAKGAALRADYAFQGYPVSAGTHQVEFVFTSPGWRLGWLIASITGAGLVILTTAGLYRKRNSWKH